MDGSIPSAVALNDTRRDRDAEFDRAYRNVSDRLVRIAQRHARDAHAAQDLLQNAAYKAFLHWRAGKPIENLEAYLTACLVSACMDLHRWSRRQRRALERLAASATLFAESAHEPVLRDEEHGAMSKAFHKLSTDCQEILDLRVLQGVSVQDVAAMLFIAEGTVKSKCSRCLDQLGRLMSD